MVNEYGVKIDRNGYAPSLLRRTENTCFLCGSNGFLQRHEIFHGTALREKSKKYGLWVTLCPDCHRLAHSDRAIAKGLKVTAEVEALEYYGWTVDEFRQRFGKSWIGESNG